jgi:glycine cleavage system H protein
MSAGLLTYRLCDRDFDCEHCPLDAALRGEPTGDPRLAKGAPAAGLLATFPQDRRYSPGHLWIQAAAGEEPSAAASCLRIGLDGFAAAILGRPAGVRWESSSGAFQQGETICEIDLDVGFLPLGAPLAGGLLRTNRALFDDPGRLLAAPYGEGWLAELSDGGGAEREELLSSEAAREKARLDLRRFRRRVAFHLLAAAEAVGPTLNDGGEPLTDLRRMLGAARYLELLRELVH